MKVGGGENDGPCGNGGSEGEDEGDVVAIFEAGEDDDDDAADAAEEEEEAEVGERVRSSIDSSRCSTPAVKTGETDMEGGEGA